MSNPTDKASVADRLMQLCHPDAEWMSDHDRITAFVNVGVEAVGRIMDLESALSPAQGDARTCTCHPDDNPPKPCPKKYALNDCREAAQGDRMRDALVKAEIVRTFEIFRKTVPSLSGVALRDFAALDEAIAALASHPDRQPTAIRRECPNCKSDALAIETDATIYCMTCGKTVGAIGLNRQPGMTDEQAREILAQELAERGMRGMPDDVRAGNHGGVVSAAIAAIKRASQRR